MQPIEKVLARLPIYKPSGKGFAACCPAHDDRNPSLSITELSDGTVRLKCFAGCSNQDIVAAIGLHTSDLFPTGADLLRSGSLRQAPNIYPTAAEATEAYGRGKPTREWAYVDAEGSEVGERCAGKPPAARKSARSASFRTAGGYPPCLRLAHCSICQRC